MPDWLWLLLVFTLGVLGSMWWVNRRQGANWGSPLLNLLDGGIRLFLKFYHRFDFQAPELPPQGGALLVSNHISGLDPFLLIAACRRPVRFLIAREQYQRFGLQWLFRAGGCIPVERHGRIEVAFRAAVRALRQGEVVALFPGGAIHPSDGPVPPLKPGVVRLAKATGVPVVPVAVSGVSAEGKVMMAVLLPGKARLVSFPPVDCYELDEQSCLQQLTDLLHQTGNTSP